MLVLWWWKQVEWFLTKHYPGTNTGTGKRATMAQRIVASNPEGVILLSFPTVQKHIWLGWQTLNWQMSGNESEYNVCPAMHWPDLSRVYSEALAPCLHGLQLSNGAFPLLI